MDATAPTPEKKGPHRYQKGCRPGPGRPRIDRKKYETILRECVTEEAAYEVFEKALEQSKEGCRHARKWLFSFLMIAKPQSLSIETSTASRADVDRVLDTFTEDESAALRKIVKALS